MAAPMNAKYHFFTGFQLAGDRDAIWDTLQDAAAWPSWWRWVKRMETVHEPTGDNAVGGAYRNRMGSPLGIGYTYTFTVTDAERYRRIELDSIGDLLGEPTRAASRVAGRRDDRRRIGRACLAAGRTRR